MSGPRAYLVERPNSQSIKFGGRFINLNEMAAEEGFSHGYLSRIIAGDRTPRVDYAKKVAKALGMGLEDFLQCCQDRKQELHDIAQRRLAS